MRIAAENTSIECKTEVDDDFTKTHDRRNKDKTSLHRNPDRISGLKGFRQISDALKRLSEIQQIEY